MHTRRSPEPLYTPFSAGAEALLKKGVGVRNENDLWRFDIFGRDAATRLFLAESLGGIAIENHESAVITLKAHVNQANIDDLDENQRTAFYTDMLSLNGDLNYVGLGIDKNGLGIFGHYGFRNALVTADQIADNVIAFGVGIVAARELVDQSLQAALHS